ncbi:MAG TPA: TonB-dependent receptor [Hyphomonadaceae bacterium]|nr:TonB-dependent receptor [Hyphomonadaceae bacterium]
MNHWKKLAGGVAVMAMSAGLAQGAFAQVTTSSVEGNVAKADGTPVGGASVTVTDTRTGTKRTVTSSDNGSFSVGNLNVGGPYTVNVTAAGEQPTQVTDVYLNLGKPTGVNLAFSGQASTDVIVITASQIKATPIAIGPATVFSQADLEEKPVINRDLKDVLKLDPRVYLDEMAGGTAGNDGVQCAGASPRFNSLTVDGIGLNDGFGLNNNGYPTERMPFPFEAISQVSVELAPFDVNYTGFTGCNINAVTKSGTNKIHGSVFYDFTNQDLRGDKSAGVSFTVPSFEEKRYGGTIGLPIIKDRLFLFGAYEKFEGSKLFTRGPIGSGAANQVPGLTQAIYDQIVSTAANVYGITDLMTTPGAFPIADEKYLLRLDANITDRHRAVVTYNYNEGLVPVEANSGNNNFEFTNHLYNRGAELKAISGQLFSDWTDDFSTELRISQNDVDYTQKCLQGGTLGEARIFVGASSVYLGCDFSRQANDLNYTVMNYKASANWKLGDHQLLFGAEQLHFDIFNLFAQGTQGSYSFADVAAFAAGTVQNGQATYRNARGTNNQNDLAASFQYDINSVYVQDKLDVTPDATVTFGLRADWYTNHDTPRPNANFLARNGYYNTENLNGKYILQPRFGFNWDLSDSLKLHGGVGLYAGGNPNVWISNGYSADGVEQIQLNSQTIPNILTNPNVNSERAAGQTINPNNALWGIPQVLFNGVANASANSTVNAIDPDFQPSAEWKFALGASWDFNAGWFGSDYHLDADFLRSQTKNAAQVVNARLARVGTAADGVSPIYKRIDPSDPDCLVAATINTAACSTIGIDDLILANVGDGGFANTYSLALRKSYDWGLDWAIAFAHVDAEDTRSLSSSTANSNFGSTAVTDINNPTKARSTFDIPNRFTMQVSYSHEWFKDFQTKISLTGQEYQARSWSYTFRNGGLDTAAGGAFGDFNEGVHLLYVPTGPNDPNVIFCQGTATPLANQSLCRTSASNATQVNFDTTSFFNFVDQTGLARGKVVGRNSADGSWTNKFDLKIEQEFPTGIGRGSLYLIIENLGNLINSDWGVPYEAPFPSRDAIVEADRDPATNKFVFRTLFPSVGEDPVRDVGFWNARVGATWKF